MMVLRTCMTVDGGIPATLKTKMMVNIIFDFVIGIVPFVGDVMDAVFKANSRNAALLEAHLREKGKKELRKSGLPIPEVDPSLPEEFDRTQRDDLPEYTESQPGRHERMTTGTRQEGRARPAAAAPPAARVRKENRSWWTYFSRPRNTDLEMGQGDQSITVDPKAHGSHTERTR